MAALAAVVRWSLDNRPVVLLATLLFVLFGVHAALTLPVDAVPDITNVQIQIITAAPALSPVEVEQYVTVPVERAMAGIPRTTEVRSVSKYGMSVVTVVFKDGTDIYFARQLTNERMRAAHDAVSAQHGVPEMGPITTGLGEIFQFTVQNEHMSLMQLEELLDWQIAPQLRTVPGIVEVNSFGGEDRQYQVLLDPKRLQAAGVSVAQVVTALEKSNANAGGGYIEHNREHFVIGTDGLVKNLDDLKRVVIGATPEGVPITIATVGEVQFGPRLRRGAASKDGRGEVAIGVALMLTGENARAVTAAVKDKLSATQASLPAGTKIEAFYDRSVLVERTVTTIGWNLLEGALLVVIVLFLLLGDLRAGLVVATTIPLSLLFAVAVMNVTGRSGNLMSLGAIDFGLIVDGAVIIVENTVRRLSERQRVTPTPLSDSERRDVVRAATLEVRTASVFGELIIAVVYLPLLTLTGIEGKLFQPMATTVLLALAGAFMLSLTLVPVLTSYLIKPRPRAHDTWLLKGAHALYLPSLRFALRHRWLTLGGSIVALAAAVLLLVQLGAEFVPQLDEGDILVEARRLPGVALSESVAEDLRLQKAILALPEVSSVVSKTGAPELATDPMGIEQTDVYISLNERDTWRPGLDKPALAEQIARALEQAVPEVAASLSQPIQMRTNELIAGVRSDVALLLYGAELEQLLSLGEQAARAIRQVPGAVDVRVEQVAGLRYLRIIPDRAKMARYGFTIEDINQLTETLSVGHLAGHVLEHERRFGIAVKMKHAFDGDLSSLLGLPLRSVSGQIVPLGDVAELVFTTGPAQVSRERQSRRITVEFNVRGRDLLSVVHDAQAATARQLKLQTGYRAEWGGQFEHYQEAKGRLSLVVPLTLALILFLLWLAFRSLRAACLIFLNVPFAIIGGVAALYLREIPFSISAGVGFIALFGVAVLNGLVLVSFARQLEEQGRSHIEAIREAAERRFLPVLMTALVASLGFMPMALSTAPGSEVQRPLATVVIGGLLSATLLTLLVLPVVYTWLGARRRCGAAVKQVLPALVVLVLVSFCDLAHADPFHQQTLPLGQRAIGMGGAFTAVADDPSATYYNPAGLVLTDESSLSASLSLQAFDKTTVQGGYRTTEGAASLHHNAGTSLPVFVSAIKLLGKRGADGRRKHAVGLSSFTVSQRHLAFDLESRGATARGGAALETLSVDTSDRTIWYGVSYAYRITRRLSLGLSSFLSVLRTGYTEQRISAQLGALDATSHSFASAGNSFTSHEVETNVKSFVWRLGALYAWNSRLFFGLMIQTPGLHIRGRASVRDRSLLTDNTVSPASSSVFNAHQSRLTSNNPTPWQVRLGGRYEVSDWLTLALDGSLIGPTGSRAHPVVSVGPRTPDPETGAVPQVGAFTTESFYRKWSGNVALGASAALPRTVTVRAGLYTDLSSAPTVPRYSATYFQPDTNRVGGTLSVGLRNQGFDLSVGTIGVFGRGKGMSFNNEATTDMTYQRTIVTERMFLFFLNGAKSAISTLAKKAEQTIMELKNGRVGERAREEREPSAVPALEPQLEASP